MALSKKRAAIIATVLTVVYFVPLFFLPESIIGHRDDDLLLFVPKILFLALTSSISTVFVLILIFRGDFVKQQLAIFNRFKYLLGNMVKRDFVARYRKSVLGVLWSVLHPLLTMIVLSTVFSLMLGRGAYPNFPIYFFSGQILYLFLNESTTMAMGSVIANEGIIKKVYVPKYIFPLSRVISTLINMMFSFIAFMFVFIFTGVQFQWTMLLIPIPIIYIFVFALGVALFMSALTVFFRDLTYLYGVFMQLLFFTTPIIYTMDSIPDWLEPIYGFNPLFHFITYFREVAIWGTVPDLWSNMVCIGFALASLCIGVYVFMKKQDRYILYL